MLVVINEYVDLPSFALELCPLLSYTTDRFPNHFVFH